MGYEYMYIQYSCYLSLFAYAGNFSRIGWFNKIKLPRENSILGSAHFLGSTICVEKISKKHQKSHGSTWKFLLLLYGAHRALFPVVYLQQHPFLQTMAIKFSIHHFETLLVALNHPHVYKIVPICSCHVLVKPTWFCIKRLVFSPESLSSYHHFPYFPLRPPQNWGYLPAKKGAPNSSKPIRCVMARSYTEEALEKAPGGECLISRW